MNMREIIDCISTIIVEGTGRWPDTEMVPLSWLDKFPENLQAHNADRADIGLPGEAMQIGTLADMAASIQKHGMRAPITILVGQPSLRACVGEGNHRLVVARRLKLPSVPLTVQVVEDRELNGFKCIAIPPNDLLIESVDSDEYATIEAYPSDVFVSLSACKGSFLQT